MNDKLMDDIKKAANKEADYFGVEADINYELISTLLAGKEYTLDGGYVMIRSENNYDFGFCEVNKDPDIKNMIRYGYSKNGVITCSYSEEHGNTLYTIDMIPTTPINGSKFEIMISVTATTKENDNVNTKEHRNWPSSKTVILNNIKNANDLVAHYNRIINMGINRFLKLDDKLLLEQLDIKDKHPKLKKASNPIKEDTQSSEAVKQVKDDINKEKLKKAAIILNELKEIYPELLTDKQRTLIDNEINNHNNEKIVKNK